MKKTENILITDNILEQLGFTMANHYWLDLTTHYIELIESDNKYYPLICELPELSSQDEQQVMVHYIEYVHELQNLVYWNFRKELKL